MLHPAVGGHTGKVIGEKVDEMEPWKYYIPNCTVQKLLDVLKKFAPSTPVASIVYPPGDSQSDHVSVETWEGGIEIEGYYLDEVSDADGVVFVK